MTMALPPVLGGASLSQQAPMQLDLDHPEQAIAQLKAIRNSVIGSRTKKSNLVHTGVIEQLVQLLRIDLNSTPYASDLVSLSATIVASLANTPAQSTLLQLMRSGTHDALLGCLRNVSRELSRTKRHILDQTEGSSDALRLVESLLRALRSILLSVADQLSASPRWGIGSTWGTKAAASGVAIARAGSNTAATKIFGKSSRECLSATSSPLHDILMSSASQDNLRAKAKEEVVETEMEQQRELRYLSRLFLAQVYDPINLPLLLGPLFMCAIPQQQATTSSAASPRPSQARLVDHASSIVTEQRQAPQASSSSASIGTTVDVETLPMTVKTKILSVVEMICAILAATIFIPGCSADPDSDGSSSLAEQIAHRRARILDFIAPDSPFAPGSTSAEAASRGRSEGVPVSRLPSGLQAEVIRKGSRSRSRMKDAETANLPPWEEDEPRSESDLTVSGPPCLFTVLLATAESGFVKAQEAALFCLAELTRDEPSASHRLFGYAAPSGTIPTTLLLNLRQSSNANVRLAAFSCLANIVKVQPFSSRTHQCVLETLMELLDTPSGPRAGSTSQGSSAVEIQIQAAFSIARLVADNVTLQTLATESFGALQKLATLLDQACSRSQPPAAGGGKAERAAVTILGSIAVSTPRPDATLGVAPPAVDESAIRLREACLTALAALTFQHDEPRRKLIDTVSPAVLSMVVSSIGFPALGVRVAACRLARALSRSLSILRTSIVDAGVAPKLVALLQDPDEEEVVKIEATAAICNLVLDFSPMKKLILELGGVDSLVSLAHTGGSPAPRDDERYYTLHAAASMPPRTSTSSAHLSGSQQLRLHALWGLKNLLSHSDTPLKTQVMDKLSFAFVARLCESPVMAFKEQALNILRNAAATKEADVAFVVSGMGGGGTLMGLVEKCIWDGREAGEAGAAVIEQAAFVLVNVATGDEECRRCVVRAPNVLDALVFFCNHPWKDVRVAAARCVGNLLSRPKTDGKGEHEDLHDEAKARLIRFGLDAKMREMAQSDVELDVRERARSALNKFGLEG